MLRAAMLLTLVFNAGATDRYPPNVPGMYDVNEPKNMEPNMGAENGNKFNGLPLKTPKPANAKAITTPDAPRQNSRNDQKPTYGSRGYSLQSQSTSEYEQKTEPRADIQSSYREYSINNDSPYQNLYADSGFRNKGRVGSGDYGQSLYGTDSQSGYGESKQPSYSQSGYGTVYDSLLNYGQSGYGSDSQSGYGSYGQSDYGESSLPSAGSTSLAGYLASSLSNYGDSSQSGSSGYGQSGNYGQSSYGDTSQLGSDSYGQSGYGGYGQPEPSSYSQSSYGGYGQPEPSSYSQSSYGGYGQPEPSSYSQSSYGGSGQPESSSYGQSGYGGSGQTGGSYTQSGYSDTSQSGYGSYGQTSDGGSGSSGYGGYGLAGYSGYSQPGYGSYSQPGYGSYSQPGYGSYSQPGYGSYSQPGYRSHSPSYRDTSNVETPDGPGYNPGKILIQKQVPINQAKGPVGVKPMEISRKLKRDMYGGPCFRGWNSFNGICYKYFLTKLNWIDAELYCQSINYEGHLASIHCRLQNTFIAELVGKGKYFHSHTWIGASDQMKKGLFLWTDGLRMDYTSWMPREPKKDRTKNCVVMNHKARSLWDDEDCNTLNTFVCSYKLIWETFY